MRGRERLSDTVIWATQDENVVAVDEATGRVTAIAAGQATVTGEAQYYGVRAAVEVSVTAP